jgi:hypothetical protein
VVLAASVELVVKPTTPTPTPVDTIKLTSPYLAHLQSDRAQRLAELRNETHQYQYTLEKIAAVYCSGILEFKAMTKTVFKADKDTTQIIPVHKIVDLLYYQCYRDHRPSRSTVARKRRNIIIQDKITVIGASMSKKEIVKFHVKEQ